jgi:hypothetical protein
VSDGMGVHAKRVVEVIIELTKRNEQSSRCRNGVGAGLKADF